MNVSCTIRHLALNTQSKGAIIIITTGQGFYMHYFFFLHQPYGASVFIPNLQMRKLRPSKVECAAKGSR